MKEIKFRAWDKKNKVMLILCRLGLRGFSHESWSSSPISNNHHHYDSLELIQYTGLKDKNGKELWESDILQLENTHAKTFRRVIVFDKGCFGYNDLTGRFYPLAIPDGNKKNEYQWEQIGNIYENPELIDY